MNQGRDVVLDHPRLGRAHPVRDALQQFRKQQHDCNEAGGDYRGAERANITARAESYHQFVNQVTNEVDGGDGKETLDEQQGAPCNSPTRGCIPDQPERSRQLRELSGCFSQLEIQNWNGASQCDGFPYSVYGRISEPPKCV